ncbi:MAG: NAD-dependent epimerase/dehydratase family protein, partial [Planctomycetota bacterium]
MNALVFGCGYLGRPVATALIAQQYQVHALTRSQERADQLAADGIRPIQGDWTRPGDLTNLPRVDRILVAVAYDRKSGMDRETATVTGFRNALRATNPQADLVYISTTGVYHQSDGEWVNASSPANPISDGGQAHLRAEQVLRDERGDGHPWVILRLAGIYGPNRIPRAADVIAGREISGDPDGWLNLIHVDDAVSAILAAWEKTPNKNPDSDSGL